MRRKRSPWKIILTFGLLGLAVLSAIVISETNLSAKDSKALYGGKPEAGYPEAGFMISYTKTGTVQTCGYSALSNTQAITASHCVDDATEIYLGTGNFVFDTTQMVKVTKVLQKEGWLNSKYRPDDFAVMGLNPNDKLQKFAEISSPVDGCFYRVVAYGRTEDRENPDAKPRKSALLCASEINANTFKVVGGSSGICFGDSGSPIFIDGTNQVVGVTVSIAKNNPNSSDPCDIGNTALVVRTDANKSLLTGNFPTRFADLSNVNTDELLVSVAGQSILEKVGLNVVQDFLTTVPLIVKYAVFVLIASFLITNFIWGRLKAHWERNTIPNQLPT